MNKAMETFGLTPLKQWIEETRTFVLNEDKSMKMRRELHKLELEYALTENVEEKAKLKTEVDEAKKALVSNQSMYFGRQTPRGGGEDVRAITQTPEFEHLTRDGAYVEAYKQHKD